MAGLVEHLDVLSDTMGEQRRTCLVDVADSNQHSCAYWQFVTRSPVPIASELTVSATHTEAAAK
jgi:hypothetical protein